MGFLGSQWDFWVPDGIRGFPMGFLSPLDGICAPVVFGVLTPPPPYTEGFHEICPAGAGYHYSASDLRYNARPLGALLPRVPLSRPRATARPHGVCECHHPPPPVSPQWHPRVTTPPPCHTSVSPMAPQWNPCVRPIVTPQCHPSLSPMTPPNVTPPLSPPNVTPPLSPPNVTHHCLQ